MAKTRAMHSWVTRSPSNHISPSPCIFIRPSIPHREKFKPLFVRNSRRFLTTPLFLQCPLTSPLTIWTPPLFYITSRFKVDCHDAKKSINENQTREFNAHRSVRLLLPARVLRARKQLHTMPVGVCVDQFANAFRFDAPALITIKRR